MAAFKELQQRVKEIRLIGTSVGIMHWDMETYMPPRGIALRSEQIGALSSIIHRMGTSPEMGKMIEAAEKEKDNLDEITKRDLYLLRKGYDEATKIPERLVAARSKQAAVAVDTWKKAKAAKDWKMFAPELEKNIDLAMERAEILKEVKGTKNIYDTMIDDFERGMSAVEISKVFAELRNGLVPLAEKCATATAEVDASFMSRTIPKEMQRKIATDLCTLVGYDTTTKSAGGRIDEVVHPFTIGYYDDVRITVTYHEDNFTSAITAILHEAGHALYEMNLNPEWKYRAIGTSSSSGIHESQSRFVENMIGRAPDFWKYYFPKLNSFTENAFTDITVDSFVKGLNLVRPSKIRIEADEVTYSLHIIIRFEIERDLLAGKITVSELPEVWNQKYEEYLGVKINDDSEGVMQDTHWASGYYGYFPSYALGNVFDGMWLQKLNEDLPTWQSDLATGKVTPSIQWMADNIHMKSDLYDPLDLVKEVTGKEMTAKPFLDYVEKKYSALFEF
ncbi:MAG: carboxypeptidase M32 [Candidatus Thorarchaeota archaeon]